MGKLKSAFSVIGLLLFFAAAHFIPQYGVILFSEIMWQNSKSEEKRESPYPIAWQKTKAQYREYYNKIKGLL